MLVTSELSRTLAQQFRQQYKHATTLARQGPFEDRPQILNNFPVSSHQASLGFLSCRPADASASGYLPASHN